MSDYVMPDWMFRKLRPAEVEQFQQWAREHWAPDTKPDPVWHPVVRDEWRRLDALHAKGAR